MPKQLRRREEEEEDQEPEAEEEEGDEDEEEEAGPGKKGKKRQRSAFIDDAAEEDSDEDEDEDGPSRRRKRSNFVDVEAAEDEAEEDDDDDEEDVGGTFLDDEGEQPTAAELNAARQAHLSREHRLPQDKDMSYEEIDRFVKERFGGREDMGDMDEDGEGGGGAVNQQALLPTSRDPRLWLVECKSGCEREAVVCLLQKAHNLAAAGNPLQIRSAYMVDHLRGYVYIEAIKESHVTDAIRGLRMIRVSKGAKQVPEKEMVDAITISQTAKSTLETGGWVRIRAGAYKEDLGQLFSVDHSVQRAVVKVVPRVDFAEISKRQKEGGRAAPFGRQATGNARPMPRAFKHEEANSHGVLVEKRRDAYDAEISYFIGSRRFRDGYELRDVSFKGLRAEEALPPLEEIQRFNQVGQSTEEQADGSNILGDAILTGGTMAPIVKFSKGDKVIVTEGDLRNMVGTITVVRDGGKNVDVLPDMEGLEAVPMSASAVEKWFASGDHVKVMSGLSEGKTGMVVRVEDHLCILLADHSREELRVFSRNLQEISDAATAVGEETHAFIGYEMHDLVQLATGDVVGVIVDIGKDTCRVLTNQATSDTPDVRVCRPAELKQKLMARRMEAPDKFGNQINTGDLVDVKQGSYLEGKSGTVKYIWRGKLFLQSKEFPGLGGFACISSNVVYVRGGSNRGARSAAGLSMLGMRSPAYLGTPSRDAFSAFGNGFGSMPQSPNMGGPAPVMDRGYGGGSGSYGGGRGGGYGGRGGGRRLAQGQRVDISKGPYKGYKGRVVSVTDTAARLELDAQYKTVTVKMGDIRGMVVKESQADLMGNGFGGHGSRTPSHQPGNRTPGHFGSATPMHPSMTPGHTGLAGSATPLHDPAWAGSQTPAHPSTTPSHPSLDGGYASSPRGFPGTPGRDVWGQAPTPASGYGSSMPAGTPQTFSTPYSPPAATPAQTPGMGAGMGSTPALVADTPAFAAPTPMLDTPGFGDGQTPGLDGLTPGLNGGYTPGGTPSFGPGTGITTPAMGLPGTPSLDGGYSLAPSSNGGAAANWSMYKGLAVRLPDGRSGEVLQALPNGTCSIALGEMDESDSLHISSDYATVEQAAQELSQVSLHKDNHVRVLSGPLSGQEGSVFIVQGDHVVVKIAGDVKSMAAREVGRLVRAS
ncbi:hypothetical protein WJX74_005873 [Apatococcus lobatus]|uniref:Transcription elongation factor SPT5 n=1 Tax=Apatococcus lobatus TaxID=904363 RepID=A0AAW1RPC7_9CHLO